MNTSNSGSHITVPLIVTSGTYTAASPIETSAATAPQSCAAITPIMATRTVPMTTCIPRATATRRGSPARATPATL